MSMNSKNRRKGDKRMPGGDKETNRYTDAVVSTIKENLNHALKALVKAKGFYSAFSSKRLNK